MTGRLKAAEAVADYQAVVSRFPKLTKYAVPALFHLGECHVAGGARDDAIKAWSKLTASADYRESPLAAEASRRLVEMIAKEGDPAEVLLNPTELGQVVVNLIANAIQASKPGDGVRVGVETADHAVRVVVEDHGCGMTDEQSARLFDPFFTTRLQQGGTGLGLSLVYGIVQDHGGTIDVQSTPGEGTTISVVLPTNPPPPPQAEHGEDPDR